LASYGTTATENRTRSYFNGRTIRLLFAVYGCIETEFSYVIFTEQRNFTTAEEEEEEIYLAQFI